MNMVIDLRPKLGIGNPFTDIQVTDLSESCLAAVSAQKNKDKFAVR